MNRTEMNIPPASPRGAHSARNLAMAAMGALVLGGLAGLAATACGGGDPGGETPTEVDRAPRAVVLGAPAESIAETALVARDVPPTIGGPADERRSGERVAVDDVLAPTFAPTPDAPGATPTVTPRAELPAAAPKTGAPAAPGGSSKTSATGRVTLVDSKMAVGVTSREPEGVADAFGLDAGQLWAWVRVANEGPPTHITMVWRRGDEVASTHRLEVGQSPGWRTWSRKSLRRWDAGEWFVDVLDADGQPLGQLRFEVTETSPNDAT